MAQRKAHLLTVETETISEFQNEEHVNSTLMKLGGFTKERLFLLFLDIPKFVLKKLRPWFLFFQPVAEFKI